MKKYWDMGKIRKNKKLNLKIKNRKIIFGV